MSQPRTRRTMVAMCSTRASDAKLLPCWCTNTNWLRRGAVSSLEEEEDDEHALTPVGRMGSSTS